MIYFGLPVKHLSDHRILKQKIHLAYQRIISNDSYAHDEQGVNPGQVRRFDDGIYRL